MAVAVRVIGRSYAGVDGFVFSGSHCAVGATVSLDVAAFLYGLVKIGSSADQGFHKPVILLLTMGSTLICRGVT